MDIMELGAIGELVGGVAVVASLIYVGVQIRHSSALARVEAHRVFYQSTLGVLGDIAKDPELHRIWRTGLIDNQQLEDAERDRLGVMLYQMFGSIAASFEGASIDPRLTAMSEVVLDRQLSSPLVREWWSRHGQNFPDPFRGFVEKRVAEEGA